ncbi:uncharacterized protein LOC123817993 [Phyllostomus hastatus]|uniref:uncharacterized protein LOC123817993 n=1 Tax=Phyllostomus hastatus TaxID=9423 RepID=UPI001E67E0E8|nr:uncharacterized protein LOC123817993 [Phyllostomus hastatus]
MKGKRRLGLSWFHFAVLACDPETLGAVLNKEPADRKGTERVPIRREGPRRQRKPCPPSLRGTRPSHPQRERKSWQNPTPVSVSPRFRSPAFTADGPEERVWWNAPRNSRAREVGLYLRKEGPLLGPRPEKRHSDPPQGQWEGVPHGQVPAPPPTRPQPVSHRAAQETRQENTQTTSRPGRAAGRQRFPSLPFDPCGAAQCLSLPSTKRCTDHFHDENTLPRWRSIHGATPAGAKFPYYSSS